MRVIFVSMFIPLFFKIYISHILSYEAPVKKEVDGLEA